MTLHAREPFSKTGSTLACAIIVAPLMALRTPLWEVWNMLTVCLLLKRFEVAKVLCLSQDISKWGHDLRSHFIWILWIYLMKFSKFDTYFLNHQTFICLSGDSIFAVASFSTGKWQSLSIPRDLFMPEEPTTPGKTLLDRNPSIWKVFLVIPHWMQLEINGKIFPIFNIISSCWNFKHVFRFLTIYI